MTEGQNCSMCSGKDHKHQVKYICEGKDCRNNMLCLSCFQSHSTTGCSAKYGEGIKEIVETPASQEEFETVDGNESPTTIRIGDYINKQFMIKSSTEEQIKSLLNSEANIHDTNNQKLSQLQEFCEQLFKDITSRWIKEQKELLRKRSESTRPEIFSRLEFLKGSLENMQFNHEDLVKNFSTFNHLNFEIVPEAEGLMEVGTEAMKLWSLDEARLVDFRNIVSEFFEGIEFSSLLNREKFDYRISGLIERSEEAQKMKQEIRNLDAAVRGLGAHLLEAEKQNKNLEGLGKRNGELEQQIKSLNIEKENLGKAKDDEKVALTTKISELTKSIEDLTKKKEAENANLTNQVAELMKSIEVLKKEKEDLTKVKDVEKEALVAKIAELTKSVQALTKAKEDLVKAKDAEKAALVKAKDDEKAALVKAKDGEKEALDKEKTALTAKVAELTKAGETLKKEKEDLAKTKDAEKVALTKAKDAEKDALSKEKNTLTAKVAELTKAVETLKKEKEELVKAKAP